MAGTKKHPVDLPALFKRVVELCMPDFRHYYRTTRKAKIVAAYATASEGGKYYADVQPLLNDDTPDPKEPIILKVEIPVIWGGPGRGFVCPPAVGTHCDLSYYDGDPNYPRISNFRWFGNGTPSCELSELIIQQETGVSIKIDKKNNIISITPGDIKAEAGKNWIIQAGENASINAGNNANIQAASNASLMAGLQATIQAPQINIVGNMSSTGANGEIGESSEKSHKTHEGSYTLDGSQQVGGNIVVFGTVTASEFIGPVRGCTGCVK